MKATQNLVPLGLGLALALALVACNGDSIDTSTSSPAPGELEKVRATGAAAADALMKSLGGQLKGALAGGDPANALEVCQQAALPLTAAAGSQFDGVTIGRTSLKPRNRANAPEPVDRAVLEKMAETMERTGKPPEPVIEWHGESASYFQPLMIKELCLKCHGDPASFSPDLVKALAERYPGDPATGYQLGDLRGAIRVDIERR